MIGLPVSDTEIALADPATGDPYPDGGRANERGELLVRGPQVMRGDLAAAGGDGRHAGRWLAAHRRGDHG